MRILDCYYISGYGKESKCTKIHGVGIGYNVVTGLAIGKGIMVASSVLSMSPVVVAVTVSATCSIGKTLLKGGLFV